MRILMTGCAGYIGSTLTPFLLHKGFQIRCIDKLIFGEDVIEHVLNERGFELVKADVRGVGSEVLRGVDCVIDMAAIANDPAGALDPELTMSINYRARVRMAHMAKEHGVSCYILFSSCSVYGRQSGVVDENSEPNPLTVYARANLLAEKDILPLASNKFTPIILRLATVYGPSRRMRFDLVVNAMTLAAYREGRIYVEGDGRQERPLVHVLDVARAVELVIDRAFSDGKVLKGEVINIGSDDQNYKIIEIAEKVKGIVGGEIVFRGEIDKRSYRVSFKKARQLLGFNPIFRIEDGIKQVYNELLLGHLKPEPRWITVEWYRRLLKEKPEVVMRW